MFTVTSICACEGLYVVETQPSSFANKELQSGVQRVDGILTVLGKELKNSGIEAVNVEKNTIKTITLGLYIYAFIF